MDVNRVSGVGACLALAGLAVACGDSRGRPTGGCDISLAPVVCAQALCGDGARDDCGPSPPTKGCTEPTVWQPCDGRDLGGMTCAGLAFASGTVSCLPTCDGFDTSQCSSCVPAASMTRCGPALPTPTNIPRAADIVATDNEVALAWVEQAGDTAPATLRFARLGANLDVLVDQPLAEPSLEISEYAARGVSPVAIATLPSGWAIAGWTGVNRYLHAIDAGGHDVAHATFDGPAFALDTFDDFAVRLASRPGGGPLWVWRVDATAQAAIVSDDGASISAPVAIPDVDAGYTLRDAVFAGGTFYVLFQSRAGYGIRVARFSPAGALLGVDSALDDVAVRGPSLVAGTDGPRLVYAGTAAGRDGGALVFQRLGANGEAPSPPRYGDADVLLDSTSAVAFGDDTVVALAIATSSPQVATTRLDGQGAMARPTTIAQVAELPWYRGVRRGPDLVVAWFGFPASLYVARVQP